VKEVEEAWKKEASQTISTKIKKVRLGSYLNEI
jgi:hypothetical protein